jgi:hypothetical protein
MTNSRDKGKRNERWFVNNGLEDVFPDIRRNANTQSRDGGVDLENTPGFNFEVKSGPKFNYVNTRKAIEQVQGEGVDGDVDVVLVRPQEKTGNKQYVQAFAMIPFADFTQLLDKLP